MRAHPFWQGLLPELPLPEEPMLEAYIQQHNLRGPPITRPTTPDQVMGRKLVFVARRVAPRF